MIDTDPSMQESPSLDEIRGKIADIFGDKVESMNTRNGLILPERTYAVTEVESLATDNDFPVEVDGKTMNVNIQGSGDDVVVLIAGRGVTSPSHDMAPLIEQLKSERTVVTLEFFGSGLSDMTDKPRTPEQIAKEIHEALEKLGAKQYSLAAHSISGIYALQCANMFPDEVCSVTGIDTAVPKMDELIKQYNPELLENELPADEPEKSVDELVAEDIADVEGYEFSERQIANMKALKARNMHNDDVFEARKEEQPEISGEKLYDTMRFPDNIPVQFCLSSESSELAPWYVGEHERQLTPAGGTVEVFKGGHFLHHNQALEIARRIKDLTRKISG